MDIDDDMMYLPNGEVWKRISYTPNNVLTVIWRKVKERDIIDLFYPKEKIKENKFN